MGHTERPYTCFSDTEETRVVLFRPKAQLHAPVARLAPRCQHAIYGAALCLGVEIRSTDPGSGCS